MMLIALSLITFGIMLGFSAVTYIDREWGWCSLFVSGAMVNLSIALISAGVISS